MSAVYETTQEPIARLRRQDERTLVPGFNRRAVKKGRPRIEDRARTNEAKKPWLKLGMSRRTWYRRQAEKRAGRGG